MAFGALVCVDGDHRLVLPFLFELITRDSTSGDTQGETVSDGA
jgi:hypothetical protein